MRCQNYSCIIFIRPLVIRWSKRLSYFYVFAIALKVIINSYSCFLFQDKLVFAYLLAVYIAEQKEWCNKEELDFCVQCFKKYSLSLQAGIKVDSVGMLMDNLKIINAFENFKVISLSILLLTCYRSFFKPPSPILKNILRAKISRDHISCLL